MKTKALVSGVMAMAMATGLLLAIPASAFDMGNMMNPSKWMGGNKDRDDYDDDYYYDGPGYGYGGYPGYGGYGGGYPGYGGYGGYGGDPYGYGGYGGAPGYGYGGAPGYGYGGAPGYGYGGAPGYGYGGAPGAGAPGGDATREAEITRLRERLNQLEGGIR